MMDCALEIVFLTKFYTPLIHVPFPIRCDAAHKSTTSQNMRIFLLESDQTVKIDQATSIFESKVKT